jgi:hypothetical protein
MERLKAGSFYGNEKQRTWKFIVLHGGLNHLAFLRRGDGGDALGAAQGNHDDQTHEAMEERHVRFVQKQPRNTTMGEEEMDSHQSDRGGVLYPFFLFKGDSFPTLSCCHICGMAEMLRWLGKPMQFSFYCRTPGPFPSGDATAPHLKTSNH